MNSDAAFPAPTLEEARAAKIEAHTIFSGLVPTSGIGITRIGDGYGLKINLKSPPTVPLPSEVRGVPVVVEIVRTLKKRG